MTARRRGSRGQAIGVIVVALPIFFVFVGFAIDFSRLFAAQARLQAAVDSAALAGSLKLAGDQNVSNGLVRNMATDYLSRNYPEATVVSILPGANERSACVTARVALAMSFMKLAGVNNGTVAATACAGFNDLEIALVLDNTGSMMGVPISMVQTAVTQLVDLLIPDSKSPRVKFSVVPFGGKVHVPGNVGDGKGDGCRNADGTVSSTNIFPPDQSCSPQALPAVQALTSDKNKIKNVVNQLQAPLDSAHTSGTVVSEGIKWGRETLTPTAPFTEGAPKNQARKVMILLTDGANEDGQCGGIYGALCDIKTDPNCFWRRNAYGSQSPPNVNCNCNDGGCLDTAEVNEAVAAKVTYGIEIFIVRYGTSTPNQLARLQQMVSPAKGNLVYYFDAPTAADIPNMFDKIGRQLAYRLL